MVIFKSDSDSNVRITSIRQEIARVAIFGHDANVNIRMVVLLREYYVTSLKGNVSGIKRVEF